MTSPPLAYLDPGYVQGRAPTGRFVTVHHSEAGRTGYCLYWDGRWHDRVGQDELEHLFGVPVRARLSGAREGYPAEPAILALWRHFVDRHNAGGPDVRYTVGEPPSLQPVGRSSLKTASTIEPVLAIQGRTIETVNELHDATMELVATWGHEVWWRGQPRSTWDLVPGAHREGGAPGTEQQLAARFKREAKLRHPMTPADGDLAGWLFLAQHFGLPTRLLDWTESPLVALFFAIRSDIEHDGVVCALHPFRLNQDQLGEGSLLNPVDPRAQKLIARAFNVEVAESPVIASVYPDQHDHRLLMQLATFTLHGLTTPLNDLPRAGEYLVRFTVPSTAKRPLAGSLDALGIRLANLFPDLQNLATQLSGLEF